MSSNRRADAIARISVTLAALLPYWRLLTFRVIYVTDDLFASDIFNGELPGRVLVGQLIRHGTFPSWTSQLCSGLPLAGFPLEPIGLLTFTFLPAAPALDLFLLVLLLIAAHGTYSLARAFGADRIGAVLAGTAFAGSGYIAAQLKHLSIVSTIVWFPIGLLLLERVLSPAHKVASDGDGVSAEAITVRHRLFLTALFGLVFAEQVLSGFPQSAYICALAYGSFAIFRAFTNHERLGRWPLSLVLLGALGLVVILAVAAGAVELLPLNELGAYSDRGQDLGWEWATALAYWPRNILTFVVPYINGDISNNTYQGPSLFWEDYGYVGFATFFLSIYGLWSQRRRATVRFVTGMTYVAFLLVLGARSRLYYLAYLVVPGMKVFRFPTRFLFVVDLGLAVLAGIGLTSLCAVLERRFPNRAVARFVTVAVCVATLLDLWFFQPRQNPMVPASEWLSPPGSVKLIQQDGPNVRTFTAGAQDLHRLTFVVARGWTDVAPYFELRELLQPNAGAGYWNIPSANCYAGITPRWSVDVWGDHNRQGPVIATVAPVEREGQSVRPSPALANLLRTYGVTHFLTAGPLSEPTLPFVGRSGMAYIYRVQDAARLRFVRTGLNVATDVEAMRRLVDPNFDPNREVLLHEAPPTRGSAFIRSNGRSTSGPPKIVSEDAGAIEVEVDAPSDGFLLLADTYYPGWIATVDGAETPIFRANLSVSAISITEGRHDVRFVYKSWAFKQGFRISIEAVVILFLILGVTAAYDRAGR